MSEVLFITPNMQGRYGDDVLGTLLLATILDNAGINCEILPFFCIGKLTSLDAFLDDTVAAIQSRMPKIVSFYTRCDTYHVMLKMAQRIKQLWPDIYIVLGGPQSDITAEDTIRQIPWVDYICCGEGETTIVPFFSSLLRGKPDTGIDGLVYRENGEVKINPRPALLQDLDNLPMINYDFFHYRSKPNVTQNTAFPIDVGRGCPFGCTYCSTKSFWGRKFRLKCPERIIEEIKHIHTLFGVTDFSFEHDMFTLNRKSVVKTCRLLQELDFPVTWHCSARLDCIDPELIDIMTASGMKSIYIGIETGSPRMQKLINKNLDLRNAVSIASYLKEKGCKTTASFIFGFPEETEEDLSHTIRLIGDLLQLKSVSIQTHLCAFLAGTELSRKYAAEMTRAEHFSDATGELFLPACRDLIDGHPELFQHLLEYKTPLRAKLQYFKPFIKLWNYMQPVYQYLSEQYSEDRLIDMYYDFVAANKGFLDMVLKLPAKEQLGKLAILDQFPKRFKDDENYDLIEDFCRYKFAMLTAGSGDGKQASQTYIFNPEDIKTKTSLREYSRCTAIVRRENDQVTVDISPRPES
ncbi:MAG: radical SAM protein [Oscillospiraceae bacterium]|nr:radical SAM protein [Oscillospiraceae bacterium]